LHENPSITFSYQAGKQTNRQTTAVNTEPRLKCV